MTDETRQISLIAVLAGGICAVVLYLFFRIKNEKEGTTIQTVISGHSMKYHYFVWWFLLPARIINNLLSYKLYEDYVVVFPLNILLSLIFVFVILNIITFVGFFTFKKYSWYSIIISNILSFCLYIVDAFFYPESDVSVIIGRVIGSLLPSALELVYYHKRKDVFVNESKYLNIKKNIIDYSRSDYNNHNIFLNKDTQKLPNENIRFCRRCGTELNEKSKYCRKCGLKVNEIEE